MKDDVTEIPSPRVLVAVANPEISARIQPLLTRAGAQAAQVDDRASFELASTRPFDLVIAQCPLSGMDAGQLLEGLRDSPIGRPPVVLMTRDAYLPTIDRLPGELREMATVTTGLTQGLRAIAHELGLSNRAFVRLMVQIELTVESARVQRVCQTNDISPTGMLLSTARFLPVGSVLPFSLELPEDSDLIHGRGEVVRHTEPDRESAPGMGVRFLGLDGNGRARLTQFIANCKARAQKIPA